MNDSWRPVVGYEGLYEVSNCGRVRSVSRTVKCGAKQRMVSERILKPSISNAGYHTVGLSKNGVSATSRVHRLVAMAFVPNPDGKSEVNHIDGNPRNNTPSNLEWCTHSENMLHAYAVLGRERMWGERTGTSVLTECSVKSIRQEKELGASDRALAKKHGVDPSTINLIVNRKIWRHI